MQKYHSKKKWIAFSDAVEELRWILTVWLEGALGRQVTQYEGSDSVIYEVGNWSKYKLVPYDKDSMPPLADLDEGVLVCVDHETCAALANEVDHVPWHPEELLYQVGSGHRTYRVVVFPLTQQWTERRVVLFDLAESIRSLEGSQ